jgi:hypothetical protein
VEILHARGYTSRIGARPGARLPRTSNEYHFSRSGQQPAIVEPHWHITSNAYYARRIPVCLWWTATVTAAIGGATAAVLTPPMQFLHLVAHYYLHYLGHHLLWSFDLALLVQQGTSWDWKALAEQAFHLGLGPFVQAALRLVERQWGVAAPAGAKTALACGRTDYGTRVAVWAARQPGSPTWMIWQAAYTPSPWLRLHLLARLALPSRAGVQRFRRGPERRRIVGAYLQRLVCLPFDLFDSGRQCWQLRQAPDRANL